MILTGARKPPLGLALHIYRETGWRHESIAPLSREQIVALGLVEKWVPRGGLKDDGVRHVPIITPESGAGSTGQIEAMSGEGSN